MKNKIKKDPLPGNVSRAELAKFWDTHSFADYWEEFKPVKVKFAKNLSSGVTIRFDDRTLTRLREEASKKGVGPTTLARMWIMDRLFVAK